MTVMHETERPNATPTDWVVEDIPAGTFRVNRGSLVDESVFRDELRSIFDRCWLYVGHESEMKPGASGPGTPATGRWSSGTATTGQAVFTTAAAIAALVPGPGQPGHELLHMHLQQHRGAHGLPGEEGYGPLSTERMGALAGPGGLPGLRVRLLRPRAVDLHHLAGGRTLDPVADRRERRSCGAHEYQRTPTGNCSWRQPRRPPPAPAPPTSVPGEVEAAGRTSAIQ